MPLASDWQLVAQTVNPERKEKEKVWAGQRVIFQALLVRICVQLYLLAVRNLQLK